jgi:hypothetical protein
VFALAVAVLTPQPAGVFWDDGVYLASARTLAHGEGYRFANLPGSPAAVHFPPLWSALLAVVWLVAPDFPANMTLFRLVNPLLAAVGAALACRYAIGTLRLPAGVAVVMVSVFAVMLPVLILTGVLFSEPMFFCMLILALFAADHAVREGGWRRALAAGALTGAVVLTRSTGLALVPAVAFALLLARRNREAVVATGTALALLLPWQLWSGARVSELAEPFRGNYGPYLSWFGAAVRERGMPYVADIARTNLVTFERTIAVVFFPIGMRELRPLLVALTVVIGVIGLAAVFQRARTLFFFLFAYTAIVIVWPYAPDRFAWAIWPLIGIVLGAGGMTAWRMARRAAAPVGERLSAGLLVGVTALLVAGAAFYTGRGISRGWADIAQRRNAERLAPVVDWVKARTPESAVIACDGDPLVYLYTGRKTIPGHILSPDEYLAGTPLQQGADDLRSLLRAGGADFAVFSAGAAEIGAAALLREGPDFPRLTPIDTLPGGGVAFRVERGR